MHQARHRRREAAHDCHDRPARASPFGSDLARAATYTRTRPVPFNSLPVTQRTQSFGPVAMSCPPGRLEAGDAVVCLFFFLALTAMFWASVRLKEKRRGQHTEKKSEVSYEKCSEQ